MNSSMRHAPSIEFETDRLRVRALDCRDQQFYCDLFTNAHTMHFIGTPWPPQRAARSFRAACRSMQHGQRNEIFLTLIEKARQQAIGMCAIQSIDGRARRAELGLMLEPAACGQGFAKEILAAATTWAFADLPIDELRVRFAVSHALAERVALSTGYLRCGDAAVGDKEPPLSSWSAYRESWGLSSARHPQV